MTRHLRANEQTLTTSISSDRIDIDALGLITLARTRTTHKQSPQRKHCTLLRAGIGSHLDHSVTTEEREPDKDTLYYYTATIATRAREIVRMSHVCDGPEDERRSARDGDSSSSIEEAMTDCMILRTDEPRGVYIIHENRIPFLQAALFQPSID